MGERTALVKQPFVGHCSKSATLKGRAFLNGKIRGWATFFLRATRRAPFSVLGLGGPSYEKFLLTH